MDLMTANYAVSQAQEYTDSVALNGVPVKGPRINPVTKHWETFDPVSNSYIDSGENSNGSIDSMTNADIQNIFNNL